MSWFASSLFLAAGELSRNLVSLYSKRTVLSFLKNDGSIEMRAKPREEKRDGKNMKERKHYAMKRKRKRKME